MATLKQLKKLLKKAGLKASGSKRALTRRAKKAHLLRGGQEPTKPEGQEKQGASKDQGSAADDAAAKARMDEMAARDLEAAGEAAAEGKRAVPGGFWRRRATRRLSKRAYRW
jgi:hypothetical protein